MYAIYFSGDNTDATIRGRTHICEWMQSGGTVRVQGISRREDLTFGCTTLELSGHAQLIAESVHFGRPLTWKPEKNIGEANVIDEAQLIGRDISINNLRFRTEDKGTVVVEGYDRFGRLGPVSSEIQNPAVLLPGRDCSHHDTGQARRV